MARFTSIGMPKKSFVASAAEESKGDESSAAGPSETKPSSDSQPKKKKRRGTRGKDPALIKDTAKSEKSWGRDPNLAKRAKLSADHAAARREKRVVNRDSNVTCFACRGVGHAARNCPNVLLAAAGATVEGSATLLGETSGTPQSVEGVATKQKGKRGKGKLGGEVAGAGKCYRCNGTDHSIHHCPEPLDPANPTPYATCFICLRSGHLSSLCPSNPGRGIYVNGGSCKICGKVDHRAKDCPENQRAVAEDAGEWKRGRREIVLGHGDGAGADEDDFMVQARMEGGRVGHESKGKMKKKPPAKNAERGMKRPREEGEDAVVGSGDSVAQPHTGVAEEVTAAVRPVKAAKKVVKF